MQIVITLNSNEELMKFLSATNRNKTEGAPAPVAAFDLPAEAPAVKQAPEPEPASEPEPTPEPEPEPAPAQTVTRQDVQAKAIALMDAGKQKQLQDLLKKYGVPALPSIPEDQLTAFMVDLEVL